MTQKPTLMSLARNALITTLAMSGGGALDRGIKPVGAVQPNTTPNTAYDHNTAHQIAYTAQENGGIVGARNDALDEFQKHWHPDHFIKTTRANQQAAKQYQNSIYNAFYGCIRQSKNKKEILELALIKYIQISYGFCSEEIPLIQHAQDFINTIAQQNPNISQYIKKKYTQSYLLTKCQTLQENFTKDHIAESCFLLDRYQPQNCDGTMGNFASLIVPVMPNNFNLNCHGASSGTTYNLDNLKSPDNSYPFFNQIGYQEIPYDPQAPLTKQTNRNDNYLLVFEDDSGNHIHTAQLTIFDRKQQIISKNGLLPEAIYPNLEQLIASYSQNIRLYVLDKPHTEL